MQPDDPRANALNPYASPAVADPFETRSVAGDLEGELRPFRTIWLRPRATIRRIVSENPTLHVVGLTCLAGIGETLDRASMRNAGDQLPLAGILAMAVILGPIGGLIGLWFGAFLFRIAGRWIGGVATSEQLRAAMAWAYVPAVFALPLWIPQLLLLGSEMFTYETPRLDSQPVLLVPMLLIMVAEMILAVWAFVLMCNTVAEVQGFRSAWKGLGNLILAGMLLIVPIMLVVFVVVAIAAVA